MPAKINGGATMPRKAHTGWKTQAILVKTKMASRTNNKSNMITAKWLSKKNGDKTNFVSWASSFRVYLHDTEFTAGKRPLVPRNVKMRL